MPESDASVDRGSSSKPGQKIRRVGGSVVNVLIIYGTTEGQTRKIAEWTATHVRKRGHQVELRDSAGLASGSGLETFHAFIYGALGAQDEHGKTDLASPHFVDDR